MLDLSSTKLLYLSIFFITTFFAYLSQSNLRCNRKYNLFLLFSLLVHWIFWTFTNIGVDYDNYWDIIKWIDTSGQRDGVEFGFNLLVGFLKKITSNYDLIIFIYKTITLLVFYKGFKMLRGKVNIAFTILTFNILVYLQGIYLLSMEMAIALLFVSYIYLADNKKYKSLLTLTLACSMHYSSLLLVPIYIIFLYHKKSKISVKSILLLSLLAFIALRIYVIIYSFATSSIAPFSQYSVYEVTNITSGSGFGQFFIFLPIFYAVYQYYRSNDTYVSINISTIFCIIAFFFAILGYKINVLMRLNMSFLPLYAILIPKYIYDRASGNLSFAKNFIANRQIEILFVLIYLFIRGYIILENFMSPESFSELSNYRFYSPF